MTSALHSSRPFAFARHVTENQYSGSPVDMRRLVEPDAGSTLKPFHGGNFGFTVVELLGHRKFEFFGGATFELAPFFDRESPGLGRKRDLREFLLAPSGPGPGR